MTVPFNGHVEGVRIRCRLLDLTGPGLDGKLTRVPRGQGLTGAIIVKLAGFRLAFPLFGFWLVVVLNLLCGSAARAQAILADRDGRSSPQTLALPYAFYNENFGFAGAYAHALVGTPQPQSALLATAMVGTKGSGMVALVGRDIRLPGTDRLFFDPVASVGFFHEVESYINGNPDFTNERAGSNSSNKNNFVKGDGWDNFFRFRFKYVLPIGLGKDDIVTTYRLDRGLLVDPRPPASQWNPLISGKTYLEARPFYRNQQIDGDDGDEKSVTNGVDLNVYWDNRDFFVNPSTGHSLKLGLSRDFGLFDSSNSWTFLQAEFDQYFSLGETEWFRQRVLAFDVWTANTPTWQVQPGGTVDHRPPAYTGATLGGLWRMRAYPSQRFNLKAAFSTPPSSASSRTGIPSSNVSVHPKICGRAVAPGGRRSSRLAASPRSGTWATSIPA